MRTAHAPIFAVCCTCTTHHAPTPSLRWCTRPTTQAHTTRNSRHKAPSRGIHTLPDTHVPCQHGAFQRIGTGASRDSAPCACPGPLGVTAHTDRPRPCVLAPSRDPTPECVRGLSLQQSAEAHSGCNASMRDPLDVPPYEDPPARERIDEPGQAGAALSGSRDNVDVAREKLNRAACPPAGAHRGAAGTLTRACAEAGRA